MRGLFPYIFSIAHVVTCPGELVEGARFSDVLSAPPPWLVGPSGSRIVLMEQIHKGTETVLYTASVEGKSSGGVVVKFGTDCRERTLGGLEFNDNEPTRAMMEVEIFQLVSPHGISPELMYASEPMQIDQGFKKTSSLTFGRFMEENMDRCIGLGSQLIYTVQERVGPSLSKWLSKLQTENWDFWASTAFSRQNLIAARKAFLLLEKLHQLGFAHGDIHYGNIAFRRNDISDISMITDLENEELVLIDFEMSRRYANTPTDKSEETFKSYGWLNDWNLSIWQLQGYHYGPRDDVYRLLFHTGNAASKYRYSSGYKVLKDMNLKAFNSPKAPSPAYSRIAFDTSHYIKTNAPLFKYSYIVASVFICGDDDLVSPEIQAEILNSLEELHVHMKETYSDPGISVDIFHVVSELDRVLSLIPLAVLVG